ncbi:hypothetical protein JXJ21_14420 [candidate division KSB1 bacterium]|nr:hypothetical protein [candidate division KSB1 bacterium]
MKKTQMKTGAAVLVMAILLLAGCATFKSDMKGKYSAPAEKNFGADGVSALFIFSHYRQTKGYDAIPKLDDRRQRIQGFDDFFQDALKEFSNIKTYATFTEYASDVNEPERRAIKDSLKSTHDFILDIRFMREKKFARQFLGQIFSVMSVTLLPIAYSQTYTVDVDIYNAQNQLIKSYSRQAALTKWVQTLLIFVYPFHPERRKKEEIYVDFLHNIFRQIESEKVLRN